MVRSVGGDKMANALTDSVKPRMNGNLFVYTHDSYRNNSNILFCRKGSFRTLSVSVHLNGKLENWLNHENNSLVIKSLRND